MPVTCCVLTIGAWVTLNRNALSGSAAPTTYILQAGTAPGLSNLVDRDRSSTGTSVVINGRRAWDSCMRRLPPVKGNVVPEQRRSTRAPCFYPHSDRRTVGSFGAS